VELAVVSQQDAIAAGIHQPRGPGQVPERQRALETLRVLPNKIFDFAPLHVIALVERNVPGQLE
jgi:hypothetical protein